MMQSYRDELEEYKEESGKVQRYEVEMKRMKDRLQEFDFYKARVEVGSFPSNP
jgi:cell shape-determining protein MreC